MFVFVEPFPERSVKSVPMWTLVDSSTFVDLVEVTNPSPFGDRASGHVGAHLCVSVL